MLKDMQDMNIYLIQMTAEQSDNNSQKSEHETLQLRYSKEKPTNLRVQAREEVSYGSNKSNFNGYRSQNNIIDWPEAAQKYSAYKVEKMSMLSRNSCLWA